MATAQDLIPLIYHEKQQAGSMLCAQHALNSLLQGNYFSAPDLSDIARSLDELEEEYDSNNSGGMSTNMDDTGFFSVQVLEKALQVWGLTLVRWRSEAMRPYQDHPQTQLAFILNYQQHWYTLRRFGAASPDPSPEANPDEGIWYNLNSSLPKPERVGSTYLGMVLQQAEAEGYSVFAIVQIDPETPLALPRTEADEVAASLSSSGGSAPQHHTGFEDEDMELQAALQASLMDTSGGGGGTANASGIVHDSSSAGYPPPISANPFNNPLVSMDTNSGVQTPTQRTRPGYSVLTEPQLGSDHEDEDDDDYVDASDEYPTSYAQPLDPVEASRRRNQALMARMMQEQEAAMRETYHEEQARIQAGLQPRRRTQQEDDDELERAIAASMAEVKEHHGTGESAEPEEMDADEAPVTAQAIPRGGYASHRVYDDDDAELQAALKASLETVPEGFRIPNTPPPKQPSLLPAPAPVSSTSTTNNPPKSPVEADEDTEGDTESEAGSSVIAEAPAVDVDEMRKRRLAKFGG